MKKKIIAVLVALILILVAIKYLPLGTKNMMMGASLVNIEVPKMSNLDSECCTFEATFKTLRSTYIIEKELDEMVEKYQKNECNGKTYYYDINNDVTITEYTLEDGLIFNKFTIKYEKGNTCNN